MLIVRTRKRLLELAINHRDDQNNQYRYNRNRYNPICSHPTPSLALHIPQTGEMGANTYEPSPSASSHFGPHTPHSSISSFSYAE